MKTKIIIGSIIAAVIIAVAIICICIIKKPVEEDSDDIFKVHTGLDLTGKYESIDTNDTGEFIIKKYIIKDSEKDTIRQYISSNWPKGSKGTTIKNEKYPIWKQLIDDSIYCTEYSFVWTPEDGGAKTAGIIVHVVDKPDGEMYIVY